MTLPLFSEPGGGAPRRVTLVRLAGEIARSLGGVGKVAVEGEVWRPTTSKSGAIFFVLRDRAAQIDVRVPSAHARRCRAVAGERVCVTGALQWVNERGQVHLVADEVSPVGEGAIAAMISEMRARLVAEGVLDRRRRPLPVLPAVIGVVCGADAAVRKDIESVIAARFPGYPVVFEETTVSGPGAQLSIVEALRAVVGRRGVGVVILARGGGDAPSLLPWSSEEVCREVAACPVPVVSAIGHDSDRPLCDEAADLRCGTPSLAATRVVPDREALVAVLNGRFAECDTALQGLLVASGRRADAVDPLGALDAGMQRAASTLMLAGERLVSVHPVRQLLSCRARAAAADWRRPVGEVLGRARGRLESEGRHLRALSPAHTLSRGYAVVTGPDGAVLRRASAVQTGDTIGVTLAAGGLTAAVTRIEDKDGDGTG